MSSRLRSAGPSLLAACLTLTLASGLVRAAPSRPTPTAAVAWPPSGGLLLSEVMTGGASASDEFIELYDAVERPPRPGRGRGRVRVGERRDGHPQGIMDRRHAPGARAAPAGGQRRRRLRRAAPTRRTPAGSPPPAGPSRCARRMGRSSTRSPGATPRTASSRARQPRRRRPARAWNGCPEARRGTASIPTTTALTGSSSRTRTRRPWPIRPCIAVAQHRPTDDHPDDAQPPHPRMRQPRPRRWSRRTRPRPCRRRPSPRRSSRPPPPARRRPRRPRRSVPPPPRRQPRRPTTIASARSAAPATAVVIEGVLTTPLGLTDGGQGRSSRTPPRASPCTCRVTAGRLSPPAPGSGWPARPTPAMARRRSASPTTGTARAARPGRGAGAARSGDRRRGGSGRGPPRDDQRHRDHDTRGAR